MSIVRKALCPMIARFAMALCPQRIPAAAVVLALCACSAEHGSRDGAYLDSDGDALPDRWETEGVDLDGDGVPELDLPAMGADPFRKDVFVEMDWMVGADGHSDRYALAAIERVQAAFAAAPVDNPNGQPGIALHVDAGPESLMDPERGTRWGALSEAGEVPHMDQLDLPGHAALQVQHQSAARRRVFRYAIAAHAVAPLPLPLCEGEDWIVNGQAEGPQMILSLSVTEGLLVELGGYLPGARDEGQQASIFMHELGHTLGLGHGGLDGINRKPNYLSVMNYSFSYRGVPIDGQYGHLDYARHGGLELDEADLDEQAGLSGLLPGEDGRVYGTLFYCGEVQLVCADQVPGQADRIAEVADARGPIDWNCNGRIDPEPVSAELNFEPPRQRFPVRSDWPHLDYTAGGALGHLPPSAPAPAATPTCGPGAFPTDRPVGRHGVRRSQAVRGAPSERVLPSSPWR